MIRLVATYFNKHLFGNDYRIWSQKKLEGDLAGLMVVGVGDDADVESCSGDERIGASPRKPRGQDFPDDQQFWRRNG